MSKQRLKNNTLNYEDRYCLFIDILGFESHIDETVSQKVPTAAALSFNKLKLALEQIYTSVHYREKVSVRGKLKPSSRRVTQFSDSVIVSYLKSEANGNGIASILMDVHNLQLKLIQKGILLRGAVTSGLLFHNEKFVFGPALIEAVALERLANYPRVILDGEILDDAGLRRSQSPQISRTISSMVKEDFDGLYYVDYFDVHPDDFDEDWNDLSYYLRKLRELIKGLAGKRSPSIKVKHSWLRTKFNAMVKPFQKSGFKTLGIRSIPDDDIVLFEDIQPF